MTTDDLVALRASVRNVLDAITAVRQSDHPWTTTSQWESIESAAMRDVAQARAAYTSKITCARYLRDGRACVEVPNEPACEHCRLAAKDLALLAAAEALVERVKGDAP